MADYSIEQAFQAIEKELMESMIRNMKRHRAEETDMKMNWSMWQTEQLKALEKYKKENASKFTSQFSDIHKQIEMLIWQSRQEGGMDQEAKILRAIKNGFKANKIGKGTSGEFFRLNTRKMEALIEATQNDLQKAERAMLRMSNDQYRKVIYSAQVYANTGAGTYEQAVDMATKDFMSRGINCIEYANGARHTISEYASMAIQTASKRAYLTGEGEKREEWGIHTVIMNKRGNACPLCLPFVGKVLIDDVWSGGSSKDGQYMLMSSAMSAGLYHPRCKDSHSTYFPGISSEGATYTKEDLQQIKDGYTAEQKQQYAKRQADKFTRLADNSLDEDNQKKYRKKADAWSNTLPENYTYHNFDKRHLTESVEDLLPEYENAEIPSEKISGYVLNLSHPKGKFKAIAFEKYLGYTQDNQEMLLEQLRDGLKKYKCSKRAATKYGSPYEVAMILKGANGNYARVKSGWIIDNGKSVPRLTSVYVDE